MAAPHKRKRPQSYSASPAPVDATASPLPRSVSGVSKRDSFADQLPLQAGRKVAFRQPAAKGSGDDEEWILATIKRCIGGDRLRYEVQDDDDVNNSFNTTLRSIIPLPDPDAPPHLSSHPSNLEDFPKGSTVLALYPDTTSFYSATVIAAPIPGTGMGLGIRNGTGRPDPGAKKENYRLAFVDDDHKVQDVHKYFVVMQ
ncbi:SAGA-associated factor 29, partial [Tremellales sp. Uapishka_1]